MHADSHDIADLNRRRRQAVEMRLRGDTVDAVMRRVGLSKPTVIAAFKAWKQGGWEAVDVGPRGRRSAAGNALEQDDLRDAWLQAATAPGSTPTLWTLERLTRWLGEDRNVHIGTQTARSYLKRWGMVLEGRQAMLKSTLPPTDPFWAALTAFQATARRQDRKVLWISARTVGDHALLLAHAGRGPVKWHIVATRTPGTGDYLRFFKALHEDCRGGIALVLPAQQLLENPDIDTWCRDSAIPRLLAAGRQGANPSRSTDAGIKNGMTANNDAGPAAASIPDPAPVMDAGPVAERLTHLQRLEAESIQIMREVVAEADNPVMLYSIGKDSAVMLHLAKKAFFPAPLPFPLLHVDTTWKFQAMYEFRERMAKEYGFELLTHVNEEGIAKGVNPFTHGSALHTDIMKTEALKQALDQHGFDMAFGGARRDEEKSRAKERVFSFRTSSHQWQPKDQRPELWHLYNTRKNRGESIRVFPLSNWTELDIWQYIHQQNIPIVPLYFSSERPVVERDGTLIMVDDSRMPLRDGEVPMMRNVRFRTLGCYPLTGAIESEASTLPEIIQEMLLTRHSERQGRVIDHDSAASMEKKKQEGYF